MVKPRYLGLVGKRPRLRPALDPAPHRVHREGRGGTGRRVRVLHGADELAVHRDREASVVVLEYAVHGRAVSTGHAYDNHFVSVITIKNRKITHWRDYLDPVAVFDAVGWPAP